MTRGPYFKDFEPGARRPFARFGHRGCDQDDVLIRLCTRAGLESTGPVQTDTTGESDG